MRLIHVGRCAVIITGVRSLCLLFLALVLGCHADAEIEDPPPESCPPEQAPCDDGCDHSGLPSDMPCPPGEWLRDGTCVPAGIAPDGCAVGFEHDGDRGCEPTLPATACPSGLMALLGETRCRELAPCAAGTWGDIPTEPDSEHVDASYTGADSDGTALQPWNSIQAAVDVAAPGAIVAIAGGSYVESITLNGKPVRLWGVCPELVEVVGASTAVATLQLQQGTGGTELHSVSIRGATHGVVVFGALDVLLDRVWVHDNAGRGVNAQDDLGPTSITIRASLLEHNHGSGVFVGSSEVTIEESVVRSTQSGGQGTEGRGLNATAHPVTGVPARVSIRSSLFEENHEIGMFTEASELTVESTVVRATQPNAQGDGGFGLSIEPQPVTGAPSTLVLRNSFVAENHEIGVFIAGSSATFEGSIVRGTESDARGMSGRGLNVQADPVTGTPSTLLLRGSLVDENRELGIFLEGSEATLEGSVVRATRPNGQGSGGRGLNVQSDLTTGASSTLLLRSSLVENNVELGVFVTDSQATIESSVIRATQLNAQGRAGHGVNVRSGAGVPTPSTLLLQSSIIEESFEAAVVVVSSNATIDSCLIRDTRPNGAGLYGEGIVVAFEQGPATATVTATRIEQSARAALSAFGAHAAISCSLLSCQAFDLGVETYHDVDAKLEDLGGNQCGCPEPNGPCRAMSADLQPPGPVNPSP